MSAGKAVGGSKRDKITEYEEIRGYILARKPLTLRMTGLFPILQKEFNSYRNCSEVRLLRDAA